MSLSAVSQYEMVRFFRRRAHFWGVIVFFVFLLLPLGFASGLVFSQHVGDAHSDDVIDTLADLERTRYLLLVVEIGSITTLAYMLAQRSIAEELEARSFTLLLQTPTSASQIIGGKLLGLAAALLVIHTLSMTILAVPAPFMRRGPLAILVEFFFGWLFACSFLPEGAAGALARIDRGRRYVLFRMATIARVMVLVLLLEAAIPQEARREGVHVWSVLVSYWNSYIARITGENLGLSVIDPMALISIVLGWQLVSGLLLWLGFVRGRIK